MTELVWTKPRILPPKGLLFALAAQFPLLLFSLPVHPSALEMAAGATLLAAGVVLNVWADWLFRRNRVGVCPFTDVPVLIADGPYRITRNPMYLGLVCLNLGVSLFSGVLANLWSSVSLAIWLHYAFVLPEEVFLRHKFPITFEEYAKRVPRLLLR